jgi:hypothetical protein
VVDHALFEGTFSNATSTTARGDQVGRFTALRNTSVAWVRRTITSHARRIAIEHGRVNGVSGVAIIIHILRDTVSSIPRRIRCARINVQAGSRYIHTRCEDFSRMLRESTYGRQKGGPCRAASSRALYDTRRNHQIDSGLLGTGPLVPVRVASLGTALPWCILPSAQR